jgi:hypothetical protein
LFVLRRYLLEILWTEFIIYHLLESVQMGMSTSEAKSAATISCCLVHTFKEATYYFIKNILDTH